MKEGLHSDRLYIHDELGVEGDLGGGEGGIYSICPYMERIIQTVGVVKSLYIVAGCLPMNKPAGFLDQGQERAGGSGIIKNRKLSKIVFSLN